MLTMREARYKSKCPNDAAVAVLVSNETHWYMLPITLIMSKSVDVPLAKEPSMGRAQQRLFLVLKVVLHAVFVFSEVLYLSIKSRCGRWCMGHLWSIVLHSKYLLARLLLLAHLS